MLAFKLMLTQIEIYQPGGVTGFKLGSSLHKFILSFDCHKGNKISVRTKISQNSFQSSKRQWTGLYSVAIISMPTGMERKGKVYSANYYTYMVSKHSDIDCTVLPALD